MVVGHRATARLVRAVEADGGGVDEVFVLDLAAAALEAGASVPGALVALGRALGCPSFCSSCSPSPACTPFARAC